MDTDKKMSIRADSSENFICGYLRSSAGQIFLACTAIRDPLVCQAQQRIAAAAHLNGDLPQGGTLEAEARRLAVNRAAQVADFLRGAFPEIL
jgi:hypothetical protein